MILPKLQNTIYQKILKPTFFQFDAENVHDFMTLSGQILGSNSITRKITETVFLYKHPSLKQHIAGLDFANPIGLSAGFDYDAKLINILPSVGFGFHTAGTITNLPYEGNPKPRLGRLPKSQSLLVNKGFKSAGIDKIIPRLKNKKGQVPLGISLGSTNKTYPDFDAQIDDVRQAFVKVIQANVGDYYELNISCPNLCNIGDNGISFSTAAGFKKLLSALRDLPFNKPVFIKMHLEKTLSETDEFLKIASGFDFVTGCIFSNLCKDRTNPVFDKDEIKTAGMGNFSGKPCFTGSNRLISFAYKNYSERFIIIGVGGIFNAQDAYAKIKAGASLVQMITGMVYQGPSIIGQINKDLVRLLKKDGFENISQAIGADHR